MTHDPILGSLPDEVKFLIEPVRRYHIRNGESAIEERVKTLTNAERQELEEIGNRVLKGDFWDNQIDRFLDDHDCEESIEWAWLYFFFGRTGH